MTPGARGEPRASVGEWRRRIGRANTEHGAEGAPEERIEQTGGEPRVNRRPDVRITLSAETMKMGTFQGFVEALMCLLVGVDDAKPLTVLAELRQTCFEE